MENNERLYSEWKNRFQAIGRAQTRYLYILLISGAFFLVLHLNIMTKKDETINEQEMPLVGIVVNPVLIWAAAPSVLGFLLLGTLGTFRAITFANKKIGNPTERKELFERLDTNPNIIDFIVYTKSDSFIGRLGLLTYPIFLLTIYIESIFIWYRFWESKQTFPGSDIFLIIGAITLLWCLYPLIKFCYLKTLRMLCK